MKFLVLLSVVACAAVITAIELSDEDKEKAKQFKTECVTESGVDEDVLQKAKHEGEFEDEETLSKFFFCFGKKAGFMDDAGELQIDTITSTITEYFDADVAQKIIDECTKEKYDTAEKTAFNFAKCSHKLKPSH